MITDLSVINDITPVAYSQGRSHILFSNEDGQPGLPELADLLFESMDQQGRQSFEGFVKQQKLWIPHECPSNSQHLLLPSAQATSSSGSYIFQGREQPVDSFPAPSLAFLCFSLSDLQVFPNREVGKDPSIIRDIAYALSGKQIGLNAANLLSLKP